MSKAKDRSDAIAEKYGLPRHESEMGPTTKAWAQKMGRRALAVFGENGDPDLLRWADMYHLPVGLASFTEAMQPYSGKNWRALMNFAAGLPFDGMEAALFIREWERDGATVTFFGLYEIYMTEEVEPDGEPYTLIQSGAAGRNTTPKKITGCRFIISGPEPWNTDVQTLCRDLKTWWAAFEDKNIMGRLVGKLLTAEMIKSGYAFFKNGSRRPTQEKVAEYLNVDVSTLKRTLKDLGLSWPL